MKRLLRSAALLAIASTAAADQPAPSLLETFLDMSIVRNAEISPPGTHVAWKEFRNDFEEDRQIEQLWVAAVDGGEPIQLTRGEQSVGDFEWSPDGRWLLFTRDGAVQVLHIAGGEAFELELEGAEGARNLRFAPDGRALYFLAGAENDDWAEAREEAYGDYTVFREEGDYAHLWRQALDVDMEADGDAKALTEGEDFSVTSFAVSPDGARILFTAWPSPHLSDLLESRVYALDPEGGEALPFADEPGIEGDLVWREDGARVALTASPGFPDYGDIVTYAADGSDRRVFDMPDHDASLVRYDDAGLLFQAGVRTRYGRYRLDTEDGAITDLDAGAFHIGATMSADGSVTATIGAPDGGLAEVFVHDAGGTRALTDFGAQLGGMARPRQTLMQWSSFDDLEIEGVLTWPADYEPGRAYPLFVRTHGGPTGTDRPGLMFAPRSIYPPAVLAAQGEGAFVLQTNYRGSASYGDAFQKTNLRQLGIGPARDIIAGVEKLVGEGKVDPTRVGCLGWSQGGHISAMLATYSNLCTAAIMGAGISDWRTYYYNTDITQFTTEYFGATPLDDDDVYALTSPVTYIENASTPTLIQHGERDARVPIANGYQLRQLLLDRGVASRMIVYAGMGHGPRTPRHLRAITEHALAWFDTYLFDGGEADFVRPIEPEMDGEEDGEEAED
ncbi:MAG: prolyl oligopeptidase family serine peptidase [Pseudomonadota bacterium]|nr:prolyl oligopeptidase family serine peptidase [Pseudomonadota bacterium]